MWCRHRQCFWACSVLGFIWPMFSNAFCFNLIFDFTKLRFLWWHWSHTEKRTWWRIEFLKSLIKTKLLANNIRIFIWNTRIILWTRTFNLFYKFSSCQNWHWKRKSKRKKRTADWIKIPIHLIFIRIKTIQPLKIL